MPKTKKTKKTKKTSNKQKGGFIIGEAETPFTFDESLIINNTKLINLYQFNGIYSYYSQRTKEKYIMFKHNKGLTVDSIMINHKLFKYLNTYSFDILKNFYQLSDHLPLLLILNF